MKENFKFNLLKEKDENDKDMQWWEKMEDGTQLMLPLTEGDTELREIIERVRDKEDKNVDDLQKAIWLVNAKMPNIYINMTGYIKTKEKCILYVVGKYVSSNFFCFSTHLIDNQIPIAWNIMDICGSIAHFLRKLPNTERLILLSKRTHITDLVIEKNEDGDIIITPKIENL